MLHNLDDITAVICNFSLLFSLHGFVKFLDLNAYCLVLSLILSIMLHPFSIILLEQKLIFFPAYPKRELNNLVIELVCIC